MHITQPDFDIAVIGGGPAGSSAAITAARLGAKVVLLEAGDFPRHKVCGEFVSAESLDVLRELLRLTPDGDRLLQTAIVIDRTRLLLGERVIDASIAPSALSIPRYILDAVLWDAAKHAGVHADSNCEVSAIHGDGPFRLQTNAGEFGARAVMVSAGRWSKFTPRSPLLDGPKWIGLKAHFREDRPPRSTDLYFFDHGYCGVQPVDDSTVNACAMVRSDRAASLQDVFALHLALAARSRNWQAAMEPVATAPLIYRTPQPVQGNLIFVGDAAAFIDPFVGDGISIALRTGRIAATELAAFLDGSVSLASAVAAYGERYRRQFVPLLTAASRIRRVLAWPSPLLQVAFECLRVPGLMTYLIRKTRHAA